MTKSFIWDNAYIKLTIGSQLICSGIAATSLLYKMALKLRFNQNYCYQSDRFSYHIHTKLHTHVELCYT